MKEKYLEAVEQFPLFFVVDEFETAENLAEKCKLLVSFGAGGQLHVVHVFFRSQSDEPGLCDTTCSLSACRLTQSGCSSLPVLAHQRPRPD